MDLLYPWVYKALNYAQNTILFCPNLVDKQNDVSLKYSK